MPWRTCTSVSATFSPAGPCMRKSGNGWYSNACARCRPSVTLRRSRLLAPPGMQQYLRPLIGRRRRRQSLGSVPCESTDGLWHRRRADRRNKQTAPSKRAGRAYRCACEAPALNISSTWTTKRP